MTRKWWRIAEIYRRFVKGEEDCYDLSDTAAKEMFDYESSGAGSLRLGVFCSDGTKPNGFAVGKHWMDVTVGMWNEDIGRGLLTRRELEDDGFPAWFLDRVVKARHGLGGREPRRR